MTVRFCHRLYMPSVDDSVRSHLQKSSERSIRQAQWTVCQRLASYRISSVRYFEFYCNICRHGLMYFAAGSLCKSSSNDQEKGRRRYLLHKLPSCYQIYAGKRKQIKQKLSLNEMARLVFSSSESLFLDVRSKSGMWLRCLQWPTL
jgi:hypothetical protein